MLGGETISDGLRRSAREMLNERAAVGAIADLAIGESTAKGESESSTTAKAKAPGATAKRLRPAKT